MHKDTGYTGHGATTGGLQGHSIGEHYPYTVMRVGERAQRFCAFDCRTGEVGASRNTYIEAAQDIAGLLIRNMMHS